MVRTILAVVAGFIVWSIVWVGSDQVLINLSRGWYGAHQFAMEKALYNGESFTADTTIMLIRVVISIVASIMAGFIASFIAVGNSRATLALGIVLLIVGIAVQAMLWSVQPIWFHVVFLILLVPMTILGGRLRKSGPVTS